MHIKLYENLLKTFIVLSLFIVILQYINIKTIMGATKTEHFTEKQNTIAKLLKAFGHPARVAIIEYLMSVDTCICGDIVNELPLAQPTVSQHLKELKNAGLIKGSIEGNTICYCMDEKAIAVLNQYFTNLNNQLQQKELPCC